MNIPNTSTVTSIPKFLTFVQTAGTPEKVTNEFLRSAGFKSSNDRALVSIFKFVGFLNDAGSPTDRWREYRDKSRSKQVLAAGIREGYSGLFAMYEDAWRKDDEAVANWIRSNTNAGGTSVERSVRTFKTLCASADFSDQENSAQTVPSPKPVTTDSVEPVQQAPAAPLGGTNFPSVNINVELHLPETTNPEVYDNFFKSMKTHLLGDGK